MNLTLIYFTITNGDQKINLKNLTKKYEDLTVLNKINFSIEVGERIAILGANGIGKTTLINCLVDSSRKDSGDVNWSLNANIGYFSQDAESHEEAYGGGRHPIQGPEAGLHG